MPEGFADLLEEGCRLLDSFCRERGWCQRLIRLVALVEGGDEVHGAPHSVRVACIAIRLAGEAKADPEVVVAASLLHDIARLGETLTGIHHAIASSEVAPTILRAIGFPEDKIELVIDAIRSHSFSLGRRPTTPEAIVVSDADKLDALGAIGAYRAIVEGVRRGRRLEGTILHYHEKLRKLASLVYTNTAKQVAEHEHKILETIMVELERILEATQKLLTRLSVTGHDEEASLPSTRRSS